MKKLKTGLVFGKFLPVHNGHIALINFAKSQCEHLIVSMSYMPDDPIDPNLRFEWLNELFKDDNSIELVKKLDDFHDESLPLFEATKIWAAFIKQEFPTIEGFFCSENYGEPLSFHLNLPCICFDIERNTIPISASAIRQNPYKHWQFIPDVVKPYFVKTICLFGPESVGKTVLTEKLAKEFDTVFVHEVARDFLTANDFDQNTIIQIAEKHFELVNERKKIANKLLFCDTEILTTQIYSRHYLQTIPDKLVEIEQAFKADLYFLLDIDSPWIADPLRDLGDRRQEMFEIFKHELEKRNINYVLIGGTWEDRFSKMKEVIQTQFLKQ